MQDGSYFCTMQTKAAIGVFDSGYGGLTVLKEIVEKLPEYDYIYLGDNARAPYGPRSFETVYQYTLECVQWFFKQGCSLVILACNTASAKALRTIQQNDLPKIDAAKRVLGVIRPTTEIVGNYSETKHVGILGTTGTVVSNSYPIEIAKFFPDVKVFQEACPMWVPLIENNEHQSKGADYFVKKHLKHLMHQSEKIDTVLLACTHYPLIKKEISAFYKDKIRIFDSAEVVARKLELILEIEKLISNKRIAEDVFYVSDYTKSFERTTNIFYGKEIHLDLHKF